MLSLMTLKFKKAFLDIQIALWEIIATERL